MIWAAAGCGYAALYIAAVLLLNGRPDALLWVGNICQLLPPLLPIVVVLRRRKEWIGRHRVFWDAIALGAALWLAGQTAWAVHELVLAHRLPVLAWTIVPELCGSAMPLMALVAWPHRGQRPEVSLMTVLDLSVLATVAAFLDWALVIVPTLPPSRSALAVQLVSVVTPAMRVAVVAGLLLAARAAAGTPWVRAYQRLAVGSAVSFVVLAMLTLTGTTNYQTGSPFDVGWMLPFFFYAWAAASMPASEAEPWPSIADAGRLSPPFLLFGALAAVPVMGYGSRFLMPLGAPFDRDREIVTSALLVWGLVAAMARNIVERRALRYADRQIRLLAAACEQSDELIVIIRRAEVRYANDAFCRATGQYSRGEVETLPALQLLPPDSADLVAETSRTLEARQLVRVTTTMVRKDGTTFSAVCTFAPIVDPRRGVTHVVCIVRDLTDEVHLREEMVRAERMAAIGDLVSSVAHELNNPLQSIVGTLDLLTAIRRDPEIRADLERACSQADRAANIVRNLLAFVRRSTGLRVLGDLAEIAQAAVASRAPALRSANIELREVHARACRWCSSIAKRFTRRSRISSSTRSSRCR